jgi:aldehyde dehydrogenase (NAD+)
MKDVHMELGGKSPVIIFEEAGLETAVAQTQFGIQFNSRQVCAANSQIYPWMFTNQ